MSPYAPTPLLQASMLQNLRLAMRRQIRRHSTRRSTSSSSRRRLGHLWSRLFHSGGRTRGHVPLLDPPGHTQITLGLHSYRTVGEQGPETEDTEQLGDEVSVAGGGSSCCSGATDLQPCTPESPVSPLSLQSVDSPEDREPSPVSREGTRAPQFDPHTAGQSDPLALNGLPPIPQEATGPPCHPRTSRKLVLELAVNLKGVSLRRYSPLGPLSPVSPSVFPSNSQTTTTTTAQTHPQVPEVTSPTDPFSSSVKAEERDCHFAVEVPSRDRGTRDERRRESKSKLCRFRTFSDEGGDSERETTPS